MPDIGEAIAQHAESATWRLCVRLATDPSRHRGPVLQDEEQGHGGEQEPDELEHRLAARRRQAERQRRLDQEIAVHRHPHQAAEPDVEVGCGAVVERDQA